MPSVIFDCTVAADSEARLNPPAEPMSLSCSATWFSRYHCFLAESPAGGRETTTSK